jgi:NADH-quinone oxidoreductase subunit G
MHEPKPPDDPDSPLSFSMEGYLENPPNPALIPFFWSPGWNSVQATAKYQQEVGGHLRGGDPGVRLIEPAESKGKYIAGIPGKFQPDEGKWLIVPLYHIFGSDETSVQAAALSERVPQPYAALNSDMAARLKVEEETKIRVPIGSATLELPVHIVKGLPNGVVGVPSAIPGIDRAVAPQLVTIETGVSA